MNKQKRLIIEVSSSTYDADYRKLKQLAGTTNDPTCFYCNNRQVIFDDNIFAKNGADYDFVFIRDDDKKGIVSFPNKITRIIDDSNKNSFAIAVHKSQSVFRYIKQAKKKIEKDDTCKKIALSEFSHEAHYPVWKQGLEPFIGGIRSPIYDELYNNLWNLITDAKSQAEVLRAEILSPMVAIDLLRQAMENKNAKIDDDLITDAKKALDGVKNKINEFCNIVGDNTLSMPLEKIVDDFLKEHQNNHHAKLCKEAELLEKKILNVAC